MKFKLNIQNFGKIEQATIQINHLTVLAGQNNVGKSFVSKALYSFFHAMTIENNILLSPTILENEFKQDFQVSKLQQLKRVASTESIRFEIESIGKIEVLDESITLGIEISGLEILGKINRVVYIESPIYWKLKSALEMSLAWVHRVQANKSLSGVPNYFYNLVNLLKLQPLDEPQFKDILEQIEQEIGGRLVLSNDGNFVFQTQNEGTHALSITALGVANLGMIAMLLEKNLIDEGTFLFIDEPEAHLHPAWQVILMKALFELARKGVNVVITTHSIDMLKCLEVLAKEDDQAKDFIALNHLGTNGHSLNEEADFDEKLNLIKKDLLEPFYQLYLEAL